MENKILYYLGQENVEYYKGEPVYIYNFIDLDTLERLSFGQCYYYIEMQKIKGFDFYENILDIRRNYNIIWNVKKTNLNPVRNLQITKMKYELLKAKLKDKNVLYNELLNELTLTKVKTFKIK